MQQQCKQNVKVSRFFSRLRLVRPSSVRRSLGFLLLRLFPSFPFSSRHLFSFFTFFLIFPQPAHCQWDMRSGEGEEIIERTGKERKKEPWRSVPELPKRRLFFLLFFCLSIRLPPSFSFPPPRPPEASTSRRPPSRCRVHAGPCEGPGGDRQEGAPCAAQCAAVREGVWTATTSGSRWAGGAGRRRAASGPAGAR